MSVNRLQILRKPAYLRNVAILKSYGEKTYKITRSSCLRNKGVILPECAYTPKGTVNKEKLSNNISRARNKVREYVLCNDFAYFCTFTIDATKYDRYGLKEYHKAFAHWIRDYNRKHGLCVQYVLIPEQHKDGAWHEHGFIMGLLAEHLTAFTLAEKLPKYIRQKLQKGEPIFNWLPYANKFGFVDIEPIHSRECAASYVTKYITKELEHSVTEIGAHLFYASQGLQKAVELKRGTMVYEPTPDYENEFCKVNWYEGTRQTVDEMKCLIVSDRERTSYNDIAERL